MQRKAKQRRDGYSYIYKIDFNAITETLSLYNNKGVSSNKILQLKIYIHLTWRL